MPESAPKAAESRLLAIALMGVAVLFFALSDASAKWLGRSLDPLMVTWARYAANMAILVVVMNPVRNTAILRTSRLRLQLVRSALLLSCTLLNFIALRYLQLTQTISIAFAMPLLVAVLAGPFLGEWVGRRRLAAIAVGLVGILVVMRPWSGSLHPAAILSVVGTVAYALYVVVTRLLASQDRSSTTTFYTGLVGVVVTTPILPFVWTTPGSWLVWALLGLVGLFSTLGHWLLIVAHARAPASVLSPFIYTQLVWMAVIGYLAFGDVPDAMTLVGAGIVIASGLYLLWWEHAERRARA